MSHALGGAGRELSYFVAVPLRRWKTVLLTTLLLGLAAVAALRVVPQQVAASSTVALNAFSAELFPDTRMASQLIDIPGEIKLARSQAVVDKAAESLGRPEDADLIQAGVDATGAVGDTTLTLSYQGGSTDEAVEVVNAVATAFLDRRQELAVDRQDQALALIDDQTASVRDQLAEVNQRLSEAPPGSQDAIDAQSEQTVLTGQITDLTARQNEVSTTVTDPGQVVSEATPSSVDVFPRPELVIPTGLLIGLVLGLLLAFLKERLDYRLRRPSQLIEAAKAPMFAVVSPAVYGQRPSVADAEQLRLLRARLLTAMERQSFSLLLLDLDGPRADRSRLGLHLGSSLVSAGLSVSMLRTGPVTGELYREERDAVERHRPHQAGSGLSIEEIGTDDVDISDLLQDRELSQRIRALQRQDRVVLVVPTVPLERSDVIALSRSVQGVVVVAHQRTNRREVVAALCDDVRGSGASVVGTLLCTSDTRRAARQRSRTSRRPEPAAVPA